MIGSLLKGEDGVTAIEYALIAALIAIVCVAAISFVGTKVSGLFSTIANSM